MPLNRRTKLSVLYTIVLIAVLLLAYIRFAPSDAEGLHHDPETAQTTGKPNEYRLPEGTEPVFEVPAQELMERLDGFIQKQPRVTRLAGQTSDLMITYVQRTRIIGYPDYITIKVVPIGSAQSKLILYTRSRFGYSDFGVNKRRVGEWVAAIQGLIAG